MSTFLELCRKAGLESGVFSGNQPSSVLNQSGDVAKLVSWTNDAWKWLQQLEKHWAWMRKDWSGALTANNDTYTAASFNLTDHGQWIIDERTPLKFTQPVSIYLTATGVADQTPLTYIDYDDFESRYRTGAQTSNRPQHYSVSDAGEIVFGPAPDAPYTARGKYRQAAQSLTTNTATPGCPAEFHDAIAWEAARRLAEHDEAWNQAKRCEGERDRIMFALRRSQLPKIRFASRPLA